MQGNLKSVQPFSFPIGFVRISVDILNELFEFSEDFKYFIHVGRVLKQEMSSVNAPQEFLRFGFSEKNILE